MSRSKNRLRWHEIPQPVREAVQALAGEKVVRAVNCEGGFSPGLASRLALAVEAQPGLPRDHTRLGGWEYVTPQAVSRYSPWAADSLGYLTELEKAGLPAAQGEALVHFDFYAHNILLTPGRVVIVDWPHARRGAPFADLVMLLASAACDGIDPEPFLRRHADPALPAATVNAFLAAHTGFLLGGAFSAVDAGHEAIAEAKLHLGLGALRWLESRLT